MHIDEVQKWCTFRAGGGTGHIVMSFEPESWTVTACGTMASGATITDERPKRICRRCRDAVGYLRPLGSTPVDKTA